MALSIRHDETEELVRHYARQKGLTMTAAINSAMKHLIANDRLLREAEVERKRKAIDEAITAFARLPVLDPTVNADDWMYDENGLPH